MADEVLRERHGHVEIVTINRPDQRNAINGAVSLAMSEIMDDLEKDDDCWVVIITGAGDKAFSAGMDLKAFASGEGGGIINGNGGFAGITTRVFPKPIIAAVNGSALAGGFEIMLSCDLVVAVEHAVFGIPEAKRGLIAGGGGLIRMPKRLPMAIALEMGMTGDSIDARRAEALGLVNKVVPADEVLERALEWAAEFARGPLVAHAQAKAAVDGGLQGTLAEGIALEQGAFAVVGRTEDARLGITSFLENGPGKASFVGR